MRWEGSRANRKWGSREALREGADVIGLALAAVQDDVGAKFGISGAAVVLIVLGIVVLAGVDADEKKRKKEQDDAVRTGEGVLASTRKANPASLTQVCSGNRHDQCTGRVAGDRFAGERDCTCTCHAVATSKFCGEMSRHDLCPGAVVLGNIGAAGCGCTCHRARSGQVEREVIATDAVPTNSRGALPLSEVQATRLQAGNVRAGDRMMFSDGTEHRVMSTEDSRSAGLAFTVLHFEDGQAGRYRMTEYVSVKRTW